MSFTPFANLYAVAARVLLGRSTNSTGPAEAIPLGATGEALVGAADAATARSTLGLGNAATRNVGTTSGTVCAGDDSRLGAGIGGSTGGTDRAALVASGTGGSTVTASPVTISSTGETLIPGKLSVRTNAGRTYDFTNPASDNAELAIGRSDTTNTLRIQTDPTVIRIRAGLSSSSVFFAGLGQPYDFCPAEAGGSAKVRFGRRGDATSAVGAGLEIWPAEDAWDPLAIPALNVLSPGGGSSVFCVDKTGKLIMTAGLRIGRVTFATLPSASANQDLELIVTDRTGRPVVKSDGTNWLKSDGTVLT